ncbi:hypothetical protein ACHAXH_006327 [Discostella pseudostelligera]
MKQKHRPVAGTALRLRAACVFINLIILLECVHAWTPQPQYNFMTRMQHNDEILESRSCYASCAVFMSTSNTSGPGMVDEDWREFRAQLVRSEKENEGDESSSSKRKSSPGREKDEDHWAYETGDFVERGSIVISVPSSNDILNDIDALNNVCYRKSIVLVLDVGPNFIQGIVLNRPTNIGVKEGMQFVQPGHGELFDNEMGFCLGDNCEIVEKEKPIQSARWKVWFGGEVGGPYSDYPQVMCLHSLTTDSAVDVSDVVLPGIFVTSFDNAQEIVRAGTANPSDFWLFCGICGWETSSFYREMHEEGLWHIVSTDSRTILEELNMLRCEEEEEVAVAQNCDIDHDPRNAGLHTWEVLMEKIGLETEAHDSENSFGDLMLHEWATGALAFSVKEEQSSMIMSPYSDPMFVDDSSDFDVSGYDPALIMPLDGELQPSGIFGVMVRASSSKRSPFLLSDQGFHKTIILILRDDDNFSEGIVLNHIYRCTHEEVINVLASGVATAEDIIVVQGSSIWTKRGIHSGVLGDVEVGFFELVPRPKIEEVWGVLLRQKLLAEETLSSNMSLSQRAWKIASKHSKEDNSAIENNTIQVFGTDVDVATLADEAALRWVKVNLLTIQ